MKAWIVSPDMDWEEYIIPVHAETRGKALSMALKVDPAGSFRQGFVDYRAKRLPALDNLPFNFENCKREGIYCEPENEPYTKDMHFNYCTCKICEEK